MKAIGLRFATTIATGAALVLCSLVTAPVSFADEDGLRSALDDYAQGKYEEALVKLREYAATNPGDEEVYRVIRQADEKVLLRALARGGDHERLMGYLLSKAHPVVEANRRDPERIQKLVDDAINGDFDVRRRADLELAGSAGDYAVPYLLPALGSEEPEKAVAAIFAFHYLGGEAVLPLAQVLSSPEARLRLNAAAVLGDLKDVRALPALRHAAESDADAGVKAKAADAITRIRATGLGSDARAVDSYVKMGQRYFANDPGLMSDPDQVHNLWRWEADGLARYEVSSALFPFALSEQHAAAALAIDGSHLGARSLLVRSVLAQVVTGRMLGEKSPESLKTAWDFVSAQGFDAASAALGDALAQKDWSVAVEACRLLADTYGKQNLAGNPLGAALAAPERRVQYAAAVAALRMSPSGAFANSAQVPSLGARAVSETALRQVFVIDDHDGARARLLMDLRDAGYVVADARDGHLGVGRIKSSATVDVVVVRADLGAAESIPMNRAKTTLAVIDELMADVRTKSARIVVIVDGNEGEIAAKKSFLTEKYKDGIAGFIEEPISGAAHMPVIEAAAQKGELNPERSAALTLAADAAMAFSQANAACGAWDFSPAIAPLGNNAKEGATDDIKMNSVLALGNLMAGGGADLAEVVKNGDAKEELRAAAATALGRVLSRVAATGDEVDVLIAAAQGGGTVGSAALRALGMATLTGEQRQAVYGNHRIEVGTKGQ